MSQPDYWCPARDWDEHWRYGRCGACDEDMDFHVDKVALFKHEGDDGCLHSRCYHASCYQLRGGDEARKRGTFDFKPNKFE